MYSLTIPRIAVPADGHRDPVRQLKTVRRPPIYPNGAQAISPAAPSPPFRCPHAVHRWIRAKPCRTSNVLRRIGIDSSPMSCLQVSRHYSVGHTSCTRRIQAHSHRRQLVWMLRVEQCRRSAMHDSPKTLLVCQLWQGPQAHQSSQRSHLRISFGNTDCRLPPGDSKTHVPFACRSCRSGGTADGSSDVRQSWEALRP